MSNPGRIGNLCPRSDDFRRLDGPGPAAVRTVHVGSEMVSLRWGGKQIMNTYWRAYCVDRAGLALTWDGGRLDYARDAITVIPGWLPFHFLPRLGVGHAYVHFEVPWLSRTATEECFPAPWHFRDAGVLQRLRAVGRDLAWARRDDAVVHLAAQEVAAATIADALDRLTPAQRARCLPSSRGALAGILGHIEDHLHETLSVAALAAAAGQGVDAFHRAFRAGSGQTPAQFLIERRVARAAGLLTGGDMPLAGIARACGFPNRHYLTRMFTRRMGASPAAYRRLHRA
jgi:AraC-like DNA-binding protein